MPNVSEAKPPDNRGTCSCISTTTGKSARHSTQKRSNSAWRRWFRLFDRARRLRHLAQHELLDLPGRSLRQLTEHEALRHLEARHVLTAERTQFIRRHTGAWLQFDERARRLAPFFIWLSHNG